jgi:hypothetical protein
VRISGLLDLEAVTARCPLVLTDCDLDDSRPVNANFATIPLLVFRDCRLAGFSGDSLTVAGNINFRESHFTGHVIIAGARIGGALQCSGMRVAASAGGYSLSGHGMHVRLSVHLNSGFVSDGAIVMPGRRSTESCSARMLVSVSMSMGYPWMLRASGSAGRFTSVRGLARVERSGLQARISAGK